eukprot:1144424-Rhodomonas_salina.2
MAGKDYALNTPLHYAGNSAAPRRIFALQQSGLHECGAEIASDVEYGAMADVRIWLTSSMELRGVQY